MTASTTVDESAVSRPPEFFIRFAKEYRWPATILLAQLPMLLLHLRNLWLRPQYQFFPVVIVLIGYLIWTRIEPLPEGVSGPKRRLRANALFASSLVLLMLGSLVVFSPWVAAVAFVLSFGGVLLLLSERYFVGNLFGIWLISCLLVPLPSAYDLHLSQFLQRITTALSGNLLERIGIFNLVEGTTLSLVSGDLFVDQACSGIVSMMSIIACALMIAVWNNRAAIHTGLLIGSAIVWAAATNILRIITLSVSQEKVGLDLASGWKHDLLGLCLLGIAMVLVFSSDRFLAWLLAPLVNHRFRTRVRATLMSRTWRYLSNLGRPRALNRVAAPAAVEDDRPVDRTRRRPNVVIAVWAGLFCVAGMISAVLAADEMARPDLTAPTFATQLQASSLPDTVNNWKLTDFGEEHADRLFAQSSKVWHYQSGDLQAVFSVDFSFHYWHDLCICYELVGWDQRGGHYEVCDPKIPGADYVKSHFQKDQRQGYLLFSFIGDDAEPFAPPDVVRSFAENVRRRVGQADRSLYQIQLWVTADRNIEPSDEEAAQKLYETLRAELLNKHIRPSSPQG